MQVNQHTKTPKETRPALVYAVGVFVIPLLQILQVCAAGAIEERILQFAHRHCFRRTLLSICAAALEPSVCAEACWRALQLACQSS